MRKIIKIGYIGLLMLVGVIFIMAGEELTKKVELNENITDYVEPVNFENQYQKCKENISCYSARFFTIVHETGYVETVMMFEEEFQEDNYKPIYFCKSTQTKDYCEYGFNKELTECYYTNKIKGGFLFCKEGWIELK